ncbi:vitamin B6 photo-protection and homoeostasis-domain-containing protein [Tuber brumale]|nr:vitamin B6 photo-protection and homoeostasis-domain-containing protein [Tuber brumale]
MYCQDSLQAFSSSIASLLSSRAVLEGFGVGDANASATGALLLTIAQDCVSRLATILFAHRFGPALEAETKRYRLAADVFNDSAMILDCLSPAFPRSVRILMLCCSGSLRAACGVAGGGSKASLSVHFARSGNVGELNAKDSSQETVIGLMGMLAGSFVVSHISSTWATWLSLTLLLAVHLGTNFKAVTAVALRTLNRQRANIVCSAFFATGEILTPRQAARRERIFEKDGVLRWGGSGVLGNAEIGVKLTALIRSLRQSPECKEGGEGVSPAELANIFQNEKYLLWYDVQRRLVTICLKEKVSPEEQLKSWVHALVLAREIRHHWPKEGADNSDRPSQRAILDTVRRSLDDIGMSFTPMLWRLKEVGWDLDVAVLETVPGYRVSICPVEITGAGKDRDDTIAKGGETKKEL